MPHSLFIGNSINRLSTQNVSWDVILAALIKSITGSPPATSFLEIPLTLIFDGLTLEAKKVHRKTREDVKKAFADYVSKLEPNKYHKGILKLALEKKIKNIITANCDYSLEKAISATWKKGKNSSTKYNLFSHNILQDVNVWHMHGEVNNPQSMVLGYDHYAGTIERMRSYLKRDYNGLKSPFRRKGITDFDSKSDYYSWVDLFLRDNIHIIGLGLDYVEIDTWWLLYYKSRLAERYTSKQKGKLSIGETHFYYFDKQNSTNEHEIARNNLLTGFSVRVHPITVPISEGKWDYGAAWDSCLTTLQKNIT